MSFHEYGLKLTKLSRYALEIVAPMSGRFVGLSHLSSKDGKVFMLIRDIDVT